MRQIESNYRRMDFLSGGVVYASIRAAQNEAAAAAATTSDASSSSAPLQEYIFTMPDAPDDEDEYGLLLDTVSDDTRAERLQTLVQWSHATAEAEYLKSRGGPAAFGFPSIPTTLNSRQQAELQLLKVQAEADVRKFEMANFQRYSVCDPMAYEYVMDKQTCLLRTVVEELDGAFIKARWQQMSCRYMGRMINYSFDANAIIEWRIRFFESGLFQLDPEEYSIMGSRTHNLTNTYYLTWANQLDAPFRVTADWKVVMDAIEDLMETLEQRRREDRNNYKIMRARLKEAEAQRAEQEARARATKAAVNINNKKLRRKSH